MGSVYLARELDLDRLVAIKVLASNWLTDEAMVERFRREARTIASLRHPSIVHVHGVGRAADLHYFIMDYIDGVSLASILRLHGALSIPVVRAILYQVGSALSYAHRPGRGVIHRDVKPANIMLDTEGNSFVTDFGISKVTESQSGLTMTGLIMGTPEYMSPEQCRGDAVTFASDQYALGAVAYAMVAGAPPFTGPQYAVLMGHTAESVPPVHEARPDCPTELAKAVHRMLAKSAAERWPDLRDALAAAGARPLLPDDPVREELIALVRAAQGSQPGAAGGAPRFSSKDTGGERTPTWLRIIALPRSLEIGEAIPLRATLGFADGGEMEGRGVRWESTDPSILRVEQDTGRMVAVGVGSAVIRAQSGAAVESAAVDVTETRVARVSLEPATLAIEVGDTARLIARPQSTREQLLERRVLWSSSDPRVASVSVDGVVHAHSAGAASILAHCEGVGAAMNVAVEPARPASIVIGGVPVALPMGEKVTARAKVLDARNQELRRSVNWSVRDPTIITVDAGGVLLGVSAGRTQLSARCDNAQAIADIEVLPVPVARIASSAPPAGMVAGDTFHLDATPLDREGHALDRAITWTVDNAKIVEPLGNGRFRALAHGTAMVTATSDGATANRRIEIEPLRVSALVIEAVSGTLQMDQDLALHATLRDQRGGTLTGTVRWSSSNAFVARVSTSGVVTGAGAGDVTITAECDGVRDSLELTVVEAPWSTVVVRPAEAGSQAAVTEAAVQSGTEGMEEIGALAGPVIVPAPRATRRRRALPWIAAVVVVGGAGSTWVLLHNRASRAGAVAATQNQPPPAAAAPPVAAVTVLDRSGRPVASRIQLTVGDTMGLSARASAADGTLAPDVKIAWRTSDPAVASIDTNGVIMGRAAGDVQLSAGAGDVVREFTVSVVGRSSQTPGRGRAAAPPSTETGGQSGRSGAAKPTVGQKPPQEPDGKLQLIVEPWAVISVDGVARRTDNRLELALPPGSHKLHLENPNTASMDTMFDVRSNETTPLRIRLREKSP